MNARRLIVSCLLLPVAAWGFEQELEQLVAASRWTEARDVLDAAARTCRESAQRDECESKVRFSRAWVYTQHAREDVSVRERRRLLERAKRTYQAILEDHPGHAESNDNLTLVLRELGDEDGLRAQLETLGASDPAKAAYVAQLIGDEAFAAGDPAGAFDAYAHGFSLSADSAALANLALAFSGAPSDERAGRLFDAAEMLLDENRIASAEAFRAIASFPDRIEEAVWDRAALMWVDVMSAERRLDAAAVQAAFDVERDAGFGALFQRLQDTYLGAPRDAPLDPSIFLASPRDEDWWTRNVDRSEALARAGWSAGHTHLLADRPDTAYTTWRGALHYAPGRNGIMLELLTDLARLTYLNRQQAEFGEIERLLFESKGLAYEVNDLPAIERHHTLLGKMYVDLGQFEEREYGVRSAEFQLSHALQSARQRAEREGISNPQPTVAMLLAVGYRCELPNQTDSCRAQPERAAGLYLDAAKGFLDLDALDQAKAAADDLKRLTPSPTLEQRELETLIETRAARLEGVRRR